MQELISPAQSEKIVVIASLMLAVIGAGWGYRAIGVRGIMAGLCGPLIFTLWQLHKYLTRYDPATNYLGLEKVRVLLLEVLLFVVVGVVLGWAWSAISRGKAKLTVEAHETQNKPDPL